MDTERVNALLRTIEEGSLTAAAEKLGYTVSGISRMMAALEEETGLQLLIRSRSGVIPTDECMQLVPIMREMAALADRCMQMAGEMTGLTRGRIRIGTSYYAYYEWFAGLISDFRRLYPGIEVEIIEGTSSELVRAMEERRADLCIISRRQGDFEWIPLKEDELLACLPEEHPMAGKKTFQVRDFAREDFIELYPGKETDNSRMLRRNKVTPRVKYATSDNYAAYAMVAAGLGVTCTNAIIGEGFVRGVRYLPLSPKQTVEIGIAIPGEKESSPAARRFAAFARDRFGGHD